MRRVRDDDAQDLFGLLALCFADYPGCFVDPHEDLPDLRAPASHAAAHDLAFWVMEDARGRVCACVAVDCPEPGLAELHRVYVRPDLRRRGIARGLVRHAEAHVRAAGATRMMLWSDTRFEGAHRLYEGLGYRASGATRELGDVSHTTERLFEKALGA